MAADATPGPVHEPCGHPLDPHVLVAFGEPADGGLMFCPQCPCVSTWSVQGRPEPEMPPPDVVARYREAVSSVLTAASADSGPS